MGAVGDLARALDPAVWAEAVAGFGLDPWQADVLRTDSKGVLMNCCRQSGKSTVAALLALHEALYVPGTLALLLSPSLRQSSELFKKVADFYGALAEPVPADAESALRIELRNGSRVVSLPGKETTVRGYSGVDLLVIDEAARVVDDLYCAVRPMLAVSGGRLVTLSTPFGKRGWWFREWSEGGDGWKRVKFTAEDCPRITDEFLAEERKHLGEWWFRQEYLCEFMDAESAAFTYEMIQSATLEEVELWQL
jgi:hypothetical protein